MTAAREGALQPRWSRCASRCTPATLPCIARPAVNACLQSPVPQRPTRWWLLCMKCNVECMRPPAHTVQDVNCCRACLCCRALTCRKSAPSHSVSRAGLTAARSSGLESPNLRGPPFRHSQKAGLGTQFRCRMHLGCWLVFDISLNPAWLNQASSQLSWVERGQPQQQQRSPAQLHHRHQVVRVDALEKGGHLIRPSSDRCAFGGSRAAGAAAAVGGRHPAS